MSRVGRFVGPCTRYRLCFWFTCILNYVRWRLAQKKTPLVFYRCPGRFREKVNHGKTLIFTVWSFFPCKSFGVLTCTCFALVFIAVGIACHHGQITLLYLQGLVVCDLRARLPRRRWLGHWLCWM